jgi:plastocyanin
LSVIRETLQFERSSVKNKLWTLATAVVIFLFIALPVAAELTELGKRFSDALITNNDREMKLIVARNKAAIPAEVARILKAARDEDITVEDRDALFLMGEKMAVFYMKDSGETSLVRDVKKSRFEARIGEPVKGERKGGVFEVKIPSHSFDGALHTFDPDNLLIKKGDTVAWINEDEHSHVFASMAVIGKGGIFAPSLDPGGKWTHRFTASGEYYYVCFIHKGMVGKVTVK